MEKIIKGILHPKAEKEEEKRKLQQQLHEASEARDWKRSEEVANELYTKFYKI